MGSKTEQSSRGPRLTRVVSTGQRATASTQVIPVLQHQCASTEAPVRAIAVTTLAEADMTKTQDKSPT